MIATQVQRRAELEQYPHFVHGLPSIELNDGQYTLRFARTDTELDEILRLRFEVFNLELNEGFESSYRTCRDEDEFDQQCHHLILQESASGRVVGTYRMQTHDMATAGIGFYSAGEFDLSALPASLPDRSVEIGRACVAKPHRSARALFLLWRGLGAYLAHNQRHFLFGCCSLTSQDAAAGQRLMSYLTVHGHVHPSVRVRPKPGWECAGEAPPDIDTVPVLPPRLMKIYLAYGAKICGPPAMDRQFKTIDYFTLLDVHTLEPKTYSHFLGTTESQ